jgi:hypothetical protein
MSVTRFPYGLGLSIAKNFEAKSANVFGEADTTPSVADGSLFYTNNTTNTIITHFDSGEEGQLITIVFIDNSTTVANSNRLYLQGSGALKGANNSITLINHNSAWHEISRSVNTSDVRSVAITGGASSINVDYCKVALLVPAATTVLSALSGGDVGQVVSVLHNSAGVTLTCITGGNIILGATNAFVMATNQLVEFVKLNGANWIIKRALVAG